MHSLTFRSTWPWLPIIHTLNVHIKITVIWADCSMLKYHFHFIHCIVMCFTSWNKWLICYLDTCFKQTSGSSYDDVIRFAIDTVSIYKRNYTFLLREVKLICVDNGPPHEVSGQVCVSVCLCVTYCLVSSHTTVISVLPLGSTECFYWLHGVALRVFMQGANSI